MSIGFRTVKRLMQSATDAPISDKAVYAMIDFLEECVKRLTVQSVVQHVEWNKLREMQGLYPKKRLTGEVVKKVLRNDD